MKKLILPLLLTLLSLPAIAQDLLDELAIATCSCAEEKKLLDMKTEEMQMQLGFCIMEAVGANEAAYQKAYGDFNPTDQKAMQKLGEDVAMRMVTRCPDVLMKLSQQAAPGQQATAPQPSPAGGQVSGQLQGISGNELAIISIKEANGRTQKLLWLGYFPGCDELMGNPKALAGKQVTASYEIREIYDPAAGEHRDRKVITGVSY